MLHLPDGGDGKLGGIVIDLDAGPAPVAMRLVYAVQELLALGGDELKLRIAIGVLLGFARLAIGLQALFQ